VYIAAIYVFLWMECYERWWHWVSMLFVCSVYMIDVSFYADQILGRVKEKWQKPKEILTQRSIKRKSCPNVRYDITHLPLQHGALDYLRNYIVVINGSVRLNDHIFGAQRLLKSKNVLSYLLDIWLSEIMNSLWKS